MSRVKGLQAESLAKTYLEKQGLRWICSNYLCKHGEIDLIMQHENTIIFIEVRYRESQQFGGPIASITAAKCKKLIKTASHYLVSLQKYDKIPCRFDMVFVYSLNNPKLDWLKNAIELN